jgi:hypothetical protein
MIWAGPFAPVLVAADPADVALDVLADGVEFEPQPTTTAAARAALLAIANVRDRVVMTLTMTSAFHRRMGHRLPSIITDAVAG